MYTLHVLVIRLYYRNSFPHFSSLSLFLIHSLQRLEMSKVDPELCIPKLIILLSHYLRWLEIRRVGGVISIRPFTPASASNAADNNNTQHEFVRSRALTRTYFTCISNLQLFKSQASRAAFAPVKILPDLIIQKDLTLFGPQ